MPVKSPVTHSDNTSFIRNFDVEKIKSLYHTETKVDVSRFFGALKDIELYQCNDTGYRFYFPFDIFGDGLFYEELEKNNTWYYQRKSWEHPEVIRFLNAREKILEIGCGDGYFMELCKKNNIHDITGLELNNAAADAGNAAGLNILKETIEAYSESNSNTYNAVCFFQVLEHITEVRSFLNAALHCLKKGGQLIIAVPNNNPYLFQWDDYHTLNVPPHHAGLWNKEAFKNLEKFFPIRQKHVLIEPLAELRHWQAMRIKHEKETHPTKAFLLSLLPKFIYKMQSRNNPDKYQGRNIIVIFEKL
ncbi:MAG: class I SAM-dependent methyltransferase [Chitinophagaceae bacterium]